MDIVTNFTENQNLPATKRNKNTFCGINKISDHRDATYSTKYFKRNYSLDN